jgi:hypothetical protein
MPENEAVIEFGSHKDQIARAGSAAAHQEELTALAKSCTFLCGACAGGRIDYIYRRCGGGEERYQEPACAATERTLQGSCRPQRSSCGGPRVAGGRREVIAERRRSRP